MTPSWRLVRSIAEARRRLPATRGSAAHRRNGWRGIRSGQQRATVGRATAGDLATVGRASTGDLSSSGGLAKRRGVWRLSSQLGSATAEFAIVVPAVLLVIAVVLSGFRATVQQIVLADRASDVARLIGRGDDGAGALWKDGVTIVRSDGPGIVCVTASKPVSLGPVVIPVSARGCALREDELANES